MAKYGIFIDPSELAIVAMKTTVGSPADGDWDSQDGGKRILAWDSKIKSLWAFESNAEAFELDASDSGPTDPGSVWDPLENAFDNNLNTFAECDVSGSAASNYLEGVGTGAPAFGGTISSVEAIIMISAISGQTLGIRIRSSSDVILDTSQLADATKTDYTFALSVPTGGWTWAKVQALEIRYWHHAGTAANIEVWHGKVVVDHDGGSDIHVATYQKNGRIAYHVFDPGGDTWTILDEEVAAPGDTGYSNIPLNDDEYGVSLALRSDGDVFLIWASGDSNELHYALREAGSWGAVEQPDGTGRDGAVVVIGPDSSDRITWVFRAGINVIKLESISSTNVESGEIDIDLTTDTSTIQKVASGVIDSGNKIYIPYIDFDDKISVGSWISGASPTVSLDTPVSDNTVKGTGAIVPPFIVACLAIAGTDVHLLYANDADADIYHDKDIDGGGTTDDEINDAVTAERISAKADAAGDNILYFYKNTGTAEVVYDTVGLANFVPSLDAFRYYEDGTETGSSAIDTQDTDISRNVDSDSDLQIRIRVQEQGAGSVGGASTDDWILQYDKNVSGFVNVTASSSNVIAFPSTNITDAAVTTNRLGAGSGSFIAGEIDEANGEVTDHELTADNFTEYLWSVTLISADLANNDTLDFRILLNGVAINSDIVPRITAVKALTTTPYYYQQLNRLQGIH